MDLSVTLIIIIITCLTSYYGWKNPEFINKNLFTPYIIKAEGAYGRFLTSGFIHKDGTHLLFNMFTFYFFGNVVESYLNYAFGQELGIVAFVLFYLIAIVIADIPTYLKEQDNPSYHALGASGGTSATVFASIILMPLSDICIFGIFCLPGFILGILFLGYAFYKGRTGGDNINHDAHFYGAVFGILVIVFISPENALHFWEQVKNFSLF
ncbi:rhomboid family intramembrane serine protease [Cyclobacterium sp. 1_MG-2023]|uniref:rhomboid family intramembrane serine protease n=1 Tax=Cyclobacterium sp. 1_MG-2023 TaxID=3062681 RepID=UPI0026E11EAA|nr:rhomboid family intramembrane serine protease [Cyclobacterium sp. 1_MG-2023]MDO6438888.1 rhomboid family intramembrane serine protease [Cyclobacterium sp. 1_MG-2023]